MKQTVSILILTTVLFFTFTAVAADKVVVVPLGSSSAKGTNKQLQFNDNGKTAGAMVYYDKTNQRVGINEPSPAKGLHISKTDTPTIRLEQDGTSWPLYIWEIASNEANFFVRDITGGGTLPFRIQPGAPTSSIYISSNGNVGLGTASPSAKLEVKGEVLSTDVNGAARLWGEGRPGVGIYNDTWTDSTKTGVQVASGTAYVTWEGVAAGCPANTWVCTLAERGTGAVATPDTNYTSCDGTTSSSVGTGIGRVTDTSTLNAAWARNVYENGTAEHSSKCTYYYAWCCRDKP